jgi:hypothetical protein
LAALADFLLALAPLKFMLVFSQHLVELEDSLGNLQWLYERNVLDGDRVFISFQQLEPFLPLSLFS